MSPNDKRSRDAAGLLAKLFAPEIRSWRGREPLWKVFWGYGVLVSAVIAAFYAGAIYGDYVALQHLLFFCAGAYSVWILVSVWRCAGNTTEPFWGLMARLLIIAWAINVVLVLAFLEIGLIGRSVG
ncbi:MAG: hypothetical protein ACK4UO_12420 [Pseudolabrys sp.]